MPKLVAALALLALPALAQEASGLSAAPSKEAPDYSISVKSERPSPAATQDRVFGGTRFWLLDAGRYEVEVWFNQKLKRDGSTETLIQPEIEIGLAPHLQLDLYQNIAMEGPNGQLSPSSEGQQIELRYSFGRHYNDLPLNPVLYLEFHPRHRAQDRAEVRLLLGGDLGPRWLWASNLFYEANIDGYNQEGSEGPDMEIGGTLAGSYEVAEKLFRLGGEIRAGGDQHGDPKLHPMLQVGPSALLKVPGVDVKLTATVFFGLFDKDPKVTSLVIAGWGF